MKIFFRINVVLIQFIIKYVLDVVFSLLLPRCMMTEHFMC